MASWPNTVVPSEINPMPHIDPVLSSMYDQGYKFSRSRYSKSKRKFEIIYRGLSRTNLLEMYVFIRDTLRGQANTFDWAFPYSEDVSSSSAATPIVITTTVPHGFRNGDTIITAGISDASANGTFLISNVTATTFSLDGSSSGASGSGGTATRKFLKMEINGSDEALYSLNKLLGPWENNEGFYTLELIFVERF
jgi:hypothetical protein